MSIDDHIEAYIAAQAGPKRVDMQILHDRIRRLWPEARLWFDDGRNDVGKVVSNPSIGYGQYTIRYADGKRRAFYQIGLSANTTGLSVYIMGLPDKTYLSSAFGPRLGKADVTGYCIKFKALKDIDVDTLEVAIRYGFETTSEY